MCYLNLDVMCEKRKLIYQLLSVVVNVKRCMTALLHISVGFSAGRVGCILQLDERCGNCNFKDENRDKNYIPHGFTSHTKQTSNMYFTPFLMYKSTSIKGKFYKP